MTLLFILFIIISVFAAATGLGFVQALLTILGIAFFISMFFGIKAYGKVHYDDGVPILGTIFRLAAQVLVVYAFINDKSLLIISAIYTLIAAGIDIGGIVATDSKTEIIPGEGYEVKYDENSDSYNVSKKKDTIYSPSAFLSFLFVVVSEFFAPVLLAIISIIAHICYKSDHKS